MGFYQLTDREVQTLNDWARTEPPLRAVFPYTDGRPGLGDRLNMLGRSGSDSAGVTDHGSLTGLLDDDHPQYRLVADDITDHGGLTGLLDNDHPQYYKSGDVITAESFYLKSSTGGGEISQSGLDIVLKANPGGHVLVDDDLVVSHRVSAEGFYLQGNSARFNGPNIFVDGEDFLRIDGSRGAGETGFRPILISKNGADVIVGNPGSEGTLINIAGSTQQSSLKVSQIGQIGDNPATQDIASLHLHRHSTDLAPGIIASRAKSDTATHANVEDGDELFRLYSTGRVGSSYEVAARIDVLVEGTPSTGILPGKIVFRTSPGDSDIGATPPEAMTIHSDAHVRMENTLNVENAVTAEAFYLKTGGELLPNNSLDHGTLLGLADDDHLQYALLNGARPFTDHVTFNDSIYAHRQITAEAFYVQGNAGSPRPPELNPTGILVDDIRGFGDLATTAGSRQINLRSPILITPVARFNGAWLGGAGATQLDISGAVDCSGQAIIIGGAVLDRQTLDNVNTSQSFTNAPTFQANTAWNEENVGSAHTVFQNAGMVDGHVLTINANSALTAWPNNSGVHLTGMISGPSVRRGSGITTGTLTVGNMAAFATNRSLGGFKGLFSLNNVGAGATVTEYSHYYAGSGGTDELLVQAGGTITTEYGIKFNNLSRGATRISLHSDSTTATMRHAGNVRIGSTTVPDYPLHVTGRTRLDGPLGVTGSFYLQGDSEQQGSARILGTLNVSANSTFGQNASVTGQLFIGAGGSASAPSITFNQFLCAAGIYPVSEGGAIQGVGVSVGAGVAAAEFGRNGLWVADKVEAEAFYLSSGDISNEVPNAVVVGGTNVAFMPPRLTTAQRDALTAVNGMMIYNTTLDKFQGYEAGAWANLI